MRKRLHFKDGVNLSDFQYIHPNLLIVLGHFCAFAIKKGLPVWISSMFSDPVKNRQSKTHEQGRAVDISPRGWTTEEIDAVIKYVEEVAGHLGAIKDGVRRAIYFHDSGTGDHFHLQVAP